MLQTHNTRTEDAQHDKRRYPTGQRRLSVERHPFAARPLAPLPVAVRLFTPPVVAAGRPPVEIARATRAIHHQQFSQLQGKGLLEIRFVTKGGSGRLPQRILLREHCWLAAGNRTRRARQSYRANCRRSSAWRTRWDVTPSRIWSPPISRRRRRRHRSSSSCGSSRSRSGGSNRCSSNKRRRSKRTRRPPTTNQVES